MRPTPEQEAFIDLVATHPQEHVACDAYAGTGKTTNLLGPDEERAAKLSEIPPSVCDHVPPGTILLAFNKKNRLDFGARLRGRNLEPHTFNSLGHKVLCSALRGRPNLNMNKNGDIVKAWVRDQPNGEEAWTWFPGLCKAVDRARTAGYLPRGSEGGASLLSRDAFEESLEDMSEPLPGRLMDVIDTLLRDHVTRALAKREIDFNDQLWLPVVFNLGIPRRHTIVVDERQDLSPLQHTWLRRLVQQRLISIGDPHQAIYGWRGADCHSCDNLDRAFPGLKTELTWCFRCPTSVISYAQEEVPGIQAAPGAPAGTVSITPELGDPPDGAMILCRNNAPIFSLALKLILAGRRPNIAGAGDISRGLANFPKTQLRLRPEDNIEKMDILLNDWERTELERARSDAKIDQVRDRTQCIRLFMAGAHTVGDYQSKVTSTLQEHGGKINLSTVHKAKGLEWSDVYIIRPDLFFPDWLLRRGNTDEIQQAHNLRYVAITRAGENLTIINNDDEKEDDQ